jgi:hypothetical protein
MTYVILIFLLSISWATGMIFYKSWQIKNQKINGQKINLLFLPEIPFRHLEKNILHFTKKIVQESLFFSVKYWFIFVDKTKKWFNNKKPKIQNFFSIKKKENNKSYRQSFFKKALIESRAKIKHIRDKVREESKKK